MNNHMTGKVKQNFASISDRIERVDILNGVQLLSMKADIDDVVTIQGSLLGGDVFTPKSNSAIAEMTAAMLDQGSTYRDKFEISKALEEVGAAVAFSAGNYRVRFGGRCMKKDVPLVIELLAEQLRCPAMNRDDLRSTKKRHAGDYKKLKEDTRTRAMEVFLQEIYPENHPNFFIPINQRIHDTGNVEVQDLKKFHTGNYGRGHLILVAVGDVNRKSLEKSVRQAFSDWQISPLLIKHEELVKAKDRHEDHVQVITMRDKASVDLVLGQPTGIDRDHEDFHPLIVGHYILGGNFSSRLMSTIRDEQGLTYAIGSAMGGSDNGNDGFWCISGSYAPQLIQQGREATFRELQQWTSGGVTEDELEAKKTTITGTYKVSLATTGGLASRILMTVERGRELSYIDEYTNKISGLTLEQVNKTIKKYCDTTNLITVVAGSIDKNWRALEE